MQLNQTPPPYDKQTPESIAFHRERGRLERRAVIIELLARSTPADFELTLQLIDRIIDGPFTSFWSAPPLALPLTIAPGAVQH